MQIKYDYVILIVYSSDKKICIEFNMLWVRHVSINSKWKFFYKCLISVFSIFDKSAIEKNLD